MLRIYIVTLICTCIYVYMYIHSTSDSYMMILFQVTVCQLLRAGLASL